jgi:riboflavin kinase/FMN adenylyltransferase
VRHGGSEGRGRRLTVPTLNLEPENRLIPGDGVYLTRVSVDRAAWNDALTNVGIRPTFGGSHRTVESHLLNPAGAADGEIIRIRFLKRLRGEEKFPDADALRVRIQSDIATATRYIGRLSRTRAGVTS